MYISGNSVSFFSILQVGMDEIVQEDMDDVGNVS